MTKNQPSLAPTRKVTAAGIGLPIAMIIVWAVQAGGIEVPPEIAAALGSVISFGLAYMAKERTGG